MIEYKKGKIEFKFNQYECNDDVDMEILCKDINLALNELKYQRDYYKQKLAYIKTLMDDEKLRL